MMYPLVQVDPLRLGGSLKWADCRGQRRRYFNFGILATAWLLRKLSKRRGRQLIVHVHTPALVIVVALALTIGARITIVNTQHNTWPNFRPHQKFGLWLMAFVSKAYIGCAEQATASLPPRMKARLASSDRLHTIPNGIPADVMRGYTARRMQVWPAAKGLDSAPRTIVIAKMSPQKNGIHLLNLVKAIPELGQVTWYGDGEMRKELQAERTRLDLDERVYFAGVVPREEVYDALARSDFYLTVSLWEGLSIADLEAVAIGCLPLMSDIPERRVIAEATGLTLLPREIVGEWRVAAQRYSWMTQEDRLATGLKLASLACDAFSLEGMIARYLEIYESVGPHKNVFQITESG
ncbi:MAG: glycosyltransferase [Puniceicoccaceae bacterium]|nr:MAG: glycosyltransferase [Puniceicoccaceae bacterium]